MTQQEKTPLHYRLARLRASLWRFHTLRFAERLFAGAPPETVLERPFFGSTLCLDVSRTNTHRLLYLEGERFLTEAPLLRSLLAPGMHVVDVGANIGYYLLLLADIVGARGAITCIEPEPDNLVELERNLRRNAPLPARIHAVAAGAEEGTAELSLGLNGSLTAGGARKVAVPVRTLDSLLASRVDCVKVDVEGYEGHVLAGGRRLLETQRPALFVEVHPALLAAPYTVSAVIAELARLYPLLEIYLPPPQATPAEKLRARYGPPRPLRVAAPESFLARRAADRGDPFWVLCRVSR